LGGEVGDVDSEGVEMISIQCGDSSSSVEAPEVEGLHAVIHETRIIPVKVFDPE
jgi:hypothetical protein